MRAIGCAKLILLLPLALGASAEEDSARDLTAMQGSWTLVSAEVNGESTSELATEPGRLRVTDDRYVATLDGREVSFRLRLESSTTPKAVELTVLSGPNQGQILKGIYQVDADRLTVCHGMTPTDVRPVEFSTGAESGQTLVVWKRPAPANR